MRVVVAPDSFKGSLDARRAAEAIATGWRRARPDDEMVLVPMADGGEGTSDVLRRVHPDAVEHRVPVCGPDDRPVDSGWLQLADGTAVVELARASGLPLMQRLSPLGAHTIGLGQLLRDAVLHPDIQRVVIALGGSASTDAGAGALSALGARWLDHRGVELTGGESLGRCVRVDLSGLLPPPPDGVRLLVDVDAPLLGPHGAAAQFGPQKGAGPGDVATLEESLARVASVCGEAMAARPPSISPGTPGAGAAGGTAYGLGALWGATLVPGAPEVDRLAGLGPACVGAGLVITGEGHLDAQSMRGKVVGQVCRSAGAADVPVLACVGSRSGPRPTQLAGTVQLVDLAGTTASALQNAAHWIEVAAERLARDWAGHRSHDQGAA